MKQFKKNIYRTALADTCPDCVPGDITIGSQTWARCNTSVSKYNDGTDIPEVQDPTAWAALTTGAWCYYNNDPSTEAAYGKFYNWYAVNDPRGLAPTGYHVPSDAEWTVLTNELGGLTSAGGALKETGLCHWSSPNTGATNSSQFSAVASGIRNHLGAFGNKPSYAFWWSSTQLSASAAYMRNVSYNNSSVSVSNYLKQYGFSVRFIKDCPTCADGVVTIGTQTWTTCNMNVTKYADGTDIPEVTDPTTWSSLTTGAWCHVNDDPANDAIYGKLYNWYAVVGIYDAASLADPLLRKQFAPTGYHVPTNAEMTYLISNTLSGPATAGREMKEVGTTHWSATNDATNTSCFTALGSGIRWTTGNYTQFNTSAHFWASSSTSPGTGSSMSLNNTASSCNFTNSTSRNYGFSVRLIQD